MIHEKNGGKEEVADDDDDEDVSRLNVGEGSLCRDAAYRDFRRDCVGYLLYLHLQSCALLHIHADSLYMQHHDTDCLRLHFDEKQLHRHHHLQLTPFLHLQYEHIIMIMLRKRRQ